MEKNILTQLSDDLEKIVRQTVPRLIHIGGGEISYRTGLWLDGDTIVTTAVSAEEGEEVTLLAEGGAAIKAKVRAFDSLVDLALLTPEKSQKFPLWEGESPRLGMLAATVAFASPAGPEARLDLVRCVEENYFQTDGGAFPGFSGGAVVSPTGKLLGLVNSNERGNRGQMLPYPYLLKLVEALKTGGSRKRKVLGVRTQPVRDGLLVTETVPGSAAEKAGLIVGDLLLKIDGKDLSEPVALLGALEESTGEVELTIKRGGQSKTLKVTPSEETETVARRWKHREHCCR